MTPAPNAQAGRGSVPMRLAFGVDLRSTEAMGLFAPDAPALELERFARLAVVLAGRVTPEYTSRFSRRDFTQPQLLAVLLLRGFMGLTYRGVVRLLRSSPPLRDALGLRKTPSIATLDRTANMPEIRATLDELLVQLMREAGGDPRPRVEDTAIDSTGFESGIASAYYAKKAEKVTEFVKVSLAVVCAWMLPCALVTSIGASNDNAQSHELVRKMDRAVAARVMYADAGYDGEPLHVLCREELGIESIIKPVAKTRDGSIRTRYRSMMTPLPESYRRRASVESVFSAIKRTSGSRLRACSNQALMTEAALKVVGYAIW